MNSILLTNLVFLVCTSPLQNERNACTYGLEATFRQSGAYDSFKNWEDKTGKEIEAVVNKNIEESYQKIIIKIFSVIRFASNRQAILQLGTGYFGESYYSDLGIQNNRLGLKWEF